MLTRFSSNQVMIVTDDDPTEIVTDPTMVPAELSSGNAVLTIHHWANPGAGGDMVLKVYPESSNDGSFYSRGGDIFNSAAASAAAPGSYTFGLPASAAYERLVYELTPAEAGTGFIIFDVNAKYFSI